MKNKKKLTQEEKNARKEKKQAAKRKKDLITLFTVIAVLLVALLSAIIIPAILNDAEAETTDPILKNETSETNSESIEGSNGDTEIKNIAPDFTVYDADGNAVKLSDYFGKPIVLNFWASWCGPCRSEMPEFNEKYLEYEGKITFLMVDVMGWDETVEIGAAYVAEQGFSFPVFFDTKQEASYKYNVSAIPTTYFIDESGRIVDSVDGAISGERLQGKIDLIYN